MHVLRRGRERERAVGTEKGRSPYYKVVRRKKRREVEGRQRRRREKERERHSWA